MFGYLVKLFRYLTKLFSKKKVHNEDCFNDLPRVPLEDVLDEPVYKMKTTRY